MPSSRASAVPSASDEDPSRAHCIALYAWFFPISPSSPGSARPDWNRKGTSQGSGTRDPFRSAAGGRAGAATGAHGEGRRGGRGVEAWRR
uniref:Uncharacterized protein n=1 Tax=Zea mays TaxID=4577 RepID=C0P8X0_MAIZE|nr:unknown [Zea mays]